MRHIARLGSPVIASQYCKGLPVCVHCWRGRRRWHSDDIAAGFDVQTWLIWIAHLCGSTCNATITTIKCRLPRKAS